MWQSLNQSIGSDYVAKFMRLFWLGGHLSWPVWCSRISKENTALAGLSSKWLRNVQNDSHHSAPLKPPPLTPHPIISHLVSLAHSSGGCRGGWRCTCGSCITWERKKRMLNFFFWFSYGVPKINVKLVLLKYSRPLHLPV